MMRNQKKWMVYILCTCMVLSVMQPGYAWGGAQRPEDPEKQRYEKWVATNSDADKSNGDQSGEQTATPSSAKRAANSLGDLWDEWSGKTSFEFLDGRHGDGTEGNPFMIRNRKQLMGLSELTAMGMTVLDGEGVSYAGDYTGCSFALAGNIDLQGLEWIPIGFYRDSSEQNGPVPKSFEGNFDGNGYTIKNMRLQSWEAYDHIGLFGSICNASIQNVTIVPDTTKELKGKDYVGILVGSAVDSIIRDVKVKNGFISTKGISGGIAGEIHATVVENVVCENIKIDALNGTDIIYVGGIAGTAGDSVIVDAQVSTGNQLTARIQGTGFIGGIVGYQNGTDLYNVSVSGTIGGEGSKSIGGMVGRYSSGKLKVAQFSGTIGNSLLGSMAREGTFIGTREGAATNFNYIDDVAYLFADSESKISANVCGSEISDDNDYTYDAHVGYWHPGDRYYTLVQAGASKNMTENCFYEELEQGILSVMDAEREENYTIDHYAPDSLGRPVRGYLVVVNQIDTVANGQNFHDVATLTVRGDSQYSELLDKDNRGAIAMGDVVYVTTTPNQTDTDKFQMDKTPYYTSTAGQRKNTTYSDSSHCYTFGMPAENLSVSADYKKVAASIKVEPEVYSFAVTQTRTGNRKQPVKITEIKNKEGKLIARYINGGLEQGTQVQPVTVNATIDANDDVADNKVKWGIDDADLISLLKNDDEGSDGYTAKSASIAVCLEAGFFTDIIAAAEKTQADENYQYKIPNTIYGAGHQNGGVAILTAATRPSTSFEGKPCVANCRINVTFQILDNTLVAAEGAVLDKQTLEYTVIRTLTGDRIAPKEEITVTAPQPLTAVFTPDFFAKDEVVWTSSDSAVIQVSQDSGAYKEASVSAQKDAKWIRDIIASDNGIAANDKHAALSGNGTRTVVVTVDGKDRLGNHSSADCHVTVRFVTEDRTRIVPEGITLDQKTLFYNLTYEKAGDINSAIVSKEGFDRKKLTAVILPDLEDTENHRPYNREIQWKSSDPDALIVDNQGNVTVVDGASWITDALVKPPYKADKVVTITAETKDGKKTDFCQVVMTFQANCVEADLETENFDIVLTKSGPRRNPTVMYTGNESKKAGAAIYSSNPDTKNVIWTSFDSEILTVDQEGNITPVLLNEKQEIIAEWVKESMKAYPYTGTVQTSITAATVDGKKDPVTVTLNFKLIDNTYSSGGSGGSASGSGGGSSTGITPGGRTQGSIAPAGSVTGTWTQTANGKWLFASGRTYASEWAYINNPYARGSQEKASWFRFDADGFMVTGWFEEENGNRFYLNPLSDGTLGQMCVGWQFLHDGWYYFHSASDGNRGKLAVNQVIDSRFTVNEKGQWVELGVVVSAQ